MTFTPLCAGLQLAFSGSSYFLGDDGNTLRIDTSELRMTLPGLSSPSEDTWHPSLKIRRLAAACLILCTLCPVLFVALKSRQFLQNMPMWDEFETVLGFVLHLRSTDSIAGEISAFFTAANEHVMVTSRFITLLLYKLTGGVNFVVLAVAGNAFAFLAVLVLGHAVASRWLGLLASAMASLLIFQLQNYENLFSSYASIDHFQIVLLTTTCLFLLTRGGGRQAIAGGLFAVLAVFTLAHGVAVLGAGAYVLYLQKRRQAFRLWAVFSVVLVAVFLWRLGSASTAGPPFHGLAGLRAMTVYWLTTVGGIVSLGNATVAVWAGLALVTTLGALILYRRDRLDPFLTAVAINSILACLVIAYGRFNLLEVSPLSSRYMVQSAMAWTSVAVLIMPLLPALRSRIAASAAVLFLAMAICVIASMNFMKEARQFSHRRVAAARYYDEHGTFVGLRNPIFPKAGKADQIVTAARDAGIFHVVADVSPRAGRIPALTPYPIVFQFDLLKVSGASIHLRGWMLTREQVSTDLEPWLLLRNGEARYLYRGLADPRPDVARAYPDRTDTGNSGFYCIIPRAALPPGDYAIDVVLIGGRRSLSNATNQVLAVPAAAAVGGTSAGNTGQAPKRTSKP